MSILNGRPLEYAVQMSDGQWLVAGGMSDPMKLQWRCQMDDPIWLRPYYYGYGAKPRFRVARKPRATFEMWTEPK